MKNRNITLIISAAIFVSFGCARTDVKQANNASPPVAVSTVPIDGNYPGRGKVTKINMELGSVELDHEEIVGVMPPMIMEFYAKEKTLLDAVKVGDNVEFVLEYKHPAETIIAIKKIQ